ncbi:MAG: hypothetical protein AB7O95_22280 [Geminicoccaceae bacterium]
MRLPDDGRVHPLPPGLGRFPLRHLDDHAGRLPEPWRKRGGVLMPMYQSEALWISFHAGHLWSDDYPLAIKIATGKINAVTGENWSTALKRHPQDYVVLPEQPWLDGFSVEKGRIRQFVAMPLGAGFTAEEQLTGTAEWGGLQLLVYPVRAEVFERERVERTMFQASLAEASFCEAMGLAPGGRMRQEVYADRRSLDDWDQRHCARLFATMLNARQWLEVTGERPPHRPPTALAYTKAGLPWFDYYNADAEALDGSETLAALSGVSDLHAKHGLPLDPADTAELCPTSIRHLGPHEEVVREGEP